MPESTPRTASPRDPSPGIRSWLRDGALKFAATRAGAWCFTRITPPLDRFLLHISHGRWNIALGVMPILLLTTTGARTGRRYRTPLLYLQDDALYLIASGGGSRRHPAWYHNALKAPVQVTVAGRRFGAAATRVSGPDHERLWGQFCRLNPGFNRYQARVARQIPIVRLVPLAPATVAGPRDGCNG
ncbi:MAG: nitroreductase/quinone reductase family protein [Pseudomonadota bacterium]